VADYYVDGTIVSAAGTGSGTQGDPWGKTDDLIAYALTQINAAGGGNVDGNVIHVLAGDLNATTTPILDFANTNTNRCEIRGRGRDQTVWDWQTNHYLTPYTSTMPAGSSGNGAYLRVSNMSITNVGAAGLSGHKLHGRSATWINCDFDWTATSLGTLGVQAGYFFNCRIPHWDQVNSGGWFVNCVITSGGATTERFGYYQHCYNCFFDWSQANNAGRVRGICDYSPVLVNCTFYMGSTDRIMCIANFDDAKIINCYQEGGQCVMNHPYNQTFGWQLITNVYAYNLSDNAIFGPYGTPTGDFFAENNVILSSSGFKDAANGDFTPNDNLIAQGTMNHAPYGSVTKVQRGTIGCFEAQNLIGKPYHPRVRGKLRLYSSSRRTGQRFGR
jgi:hypothetical protein